MNQEIRAANKVGNFNETVTLVMSRLTQVATNGKGTKFRNFAVRIPNNYSDDMQGDVEQQPTELFCVTFDENIMQMLDSLDPTEMPRVRISAYLDGVWRIYKANNTLEGIRSIVPDIGQEPMPLPDGDVLYPTNKPYELDGVVPNAIVYPGVTLNVVSMQPATNVTSTEVAVENQSGFAQAQEKLNQVTEQPEQTANGAVAQQNGATVQQNQANKVPFGG